MLFRSIAAELHVGGVPRDVQLRGDARVVYRATMTPETIEGFDPDFARDPAAKVLSAEC